MTQTDTNTSGTSSDQNSPGVGQVRRTRWQRRFALLLVVAVCWFVFTRGDSRVVGRWVVSGFLEETEYRFNSNGTYSKHELRSGKRIGRDRGRNLWRVENEVLILSYKEPLWPDDGPVWQRIGQFVVNAITSLRSSPVNDHRIHRFKIVRASRNTLVFEHAVQWRRRDPGD